MQPTKKNEDIRNIWNSYYIILLLYHAGITYFQSTTFIICHGNMHKCKEEKSSESVNCIGEGWLNFLPGYFGWPVATTGQVISIKAHWFKVNDFG